MALEPLKIIKNWFTNTRTREQNWDEIANNLVSKSVRDNNNFKQLGLDIGGSSYDFNNVGKSTQTVSLISRVMPLEFTNGFSGNLGLNVSDTTKITICSSSGADLSASNTGKILFNSGGRLISYTLTSNLSVTLTGAHWGFDTFGDKTDVRLWVMLINSGTSVVLGVSLEGGSNFISTSDDETIQASVNSSEKVLVSSALPANCDVSYLGWINADFDDTGNAGGENYWTIQTGVGDINLSPVQNYFEGEVRF